MAAKKTVGELIKEARVNAKLTQEQLAKQVEGVTASDISKAERGEKELTQNALKQIAKITGVTQKSLLEAASGSSSSAAKKPATTAAKKPAATAAKKPAASSTAKKPAGTAAKQTTSAGTSVKVTAAEKRILELYRAADSATKKNAEAVLKGTKKVAEDNNLMDALLGGAADLINNLGKK